MEHQYHISSDIKYSLALLKGSVSKTIFVSDAARVGE